MDIEYLGYISSVGCEPKCLPAHLRVLPAEINFFWVLVTRKIVYGARDAVMYGTRELRKHNICRAARKNDFVRIDMYSMC